MDIKKTLNGKVLDEKHKTYIQSLKQAMDKVCDKHKGFSYEIRIGESRV
jgi:hypothetical protein